MNKDDQMEEKVVEILNLSLKRINKHTAARLQYIRNNALDNLEFKDKMIPNGKGGHIFAAIGWNSNATKVFFSVLFLLFLAWASISWQVRYHHDDHGAADSNYLTDDSGNDSFLEDHHEPWQHPGYNIK